MATKKTESVMSQRLANIESAILEMQEQINQTKAQMDTLDRVMADLQEIKRNTKRKKISLFGRKPPEEDKMTQVTSLLRNPMVQSMLKKSGKLGNGFDLSGIASLLQEPIVQSMLNSQNGKGKKEKKTGASPAGVPEVMQLFKSPAIQSFLKNLQ